MNRFLPYPLLSLAVLGTWLALNNSLTPGQVLLGAVLGLLLPLTVRRLAPVSLRNRRPAVAARLLLRVAGDIVMANLQVAVLIIGPERRLRPAFVRMPLELMDPVGIAILGGIITLTPGTVSCDLLDDGRTLLVHGLDVADADALIATIRTRYEAPLGMIFPARESTP